jgi:hypothetical protein
MPPAKRTTTPAGKTAAAAKKAEAVVEDAVEHVAEICRACWPNGWPHLSHSASCDHGTYVRNAAEAPAAGDEKTAEEKTPADDSKTSAEDGKTPEDAPPTGETTGD